VAVPWHCPQSAASLCMLKRHAPNNRYVRAGRGDAYAINAWIGPPGTVSPLHRDPTHNILTQLYGEKRVLLYSVKAGDRDSM
jgi:hypothetical protein